MDLLHFAKYKYTDCTIFISLKHMTQFMTQNQFYINNM